MHTKFCLIKQKENNTIVMEDTKQVVLQEEHLIHSNNLPRISTKTKDTLLEMNFELVLEEKEEMILPKLSN